MSTTLATFSRLMDNKFTQTWYDIKSEAIDNILLGTPVWAALKKMGCFKTQVGGDRISKTVRYALPATQNFNKGTVFANTEVETRTAAFWTWRYVGTSIVRSLVDDQQNQGKYRISSYVSDRVQEARDTLAQNYEVKVLQAEVTDESGNDIQGLNDIVPAFANRATGTYGTISRGNDWWVPKYKQMTTPYEVNLGSDMKNLFNTISANQEAPNLIVMDQTLFETYEEFGLDASQVVKNDEFTLDIGFKVLNFKGAPMIWSPNMTTNNALFLNTNYIDVFYDPTVWFDMTAWKETPNQLERAAQIVCAMNIVSSSLRRHGRLYA